MVYRSIAEKLGTAFARLGEGRVDKIKPADVEKVIAKLNKRLDALRREAAQNPENAKRIAVKQRVAEDLLMRAQWLLAEIRDGGTPPLSPLGAAKLDPPMRED